MNEKRVERLTEALGGVETEVIRIEDFSGLREILTELPAPYCVNTELHKLPALNGLKPVTESPSDAMTGITTAHLGVAFTGTLLVDGRDLCSLLPEISVLLLPVEKIVEEYDELIDYVASHPNDHLVAVTGPSMTADIEKTLVLGAHGPCRLIVILVERM